MIKPLVSFKSNPSNQIFQPFILCCLVLSLFINIRYIFFSPASFPEATDSLNMRVNSIGGYNNGFFNSQNLIEKGLNSSDLSIGGGGSDSNHIRKVPASGVQLVINPSRHDLDKYLNPVLFDPSTMRFSSVGLKYQNKGSCVCGPDKYCLCTPSLAIDCIIEYIPSSSSLSSAASSHPKSLISDLKKASSSSSSNNNNNVNSNNPANINNKIVNSNKDSSQSKPNINMNSRGLSSKQSSPNTQSHPPSPSTRSVILIRRRDPPADVYAIPGGFVDIGESAENATIREMKEEIHLNIDPKQLKQFRTYSDPLRDKRRHTVSVVFHVTVSDISTLRKGDDAKAIEIVPIDKIKTLDFGFDHKAVLMEYFGLI